MIKILQVSNLDNFVESRRQKTSQKDRKIVQSILDDVRKNGDSAVKKYEQKFNGKKTTQLRLNKQEITQAKISIEEFNALKLSAVKLSKQQRNLKKNLVQSVKKIPNVSFVPVPTVGCYIPGGQARYPSSAIMSVITAAEAGVEKIIVVSPPDSNGKIDPMTITVAQNCGAEIYKMGGAQAIAALAYGTKSLPKVCLLYTSPSPRDLSTSRMPSSA